VSRDRTLSPDTSFLFISSAGLFFIILVGFVVFLSNCEDWLGIGVIGSFIRGADYARISEIINEFC
jgi:hypothetical protein